MEGAEHAWIGDQITLQFRGIGPRRADTYGLATDGPTLTYGECIALGGDFYGVVGSPISTAPNSGAAFIDAWNSLMNGGDEVRAILEIMQVEIDAVHAAQAKGIEPSKAYEKLGDSLSGRWNRLTGGGCAFTDLYPFGRYLQLSAENWDHFNTYALVAYKAGHANAMYQARLAREGHEDMQDVLLARAYAMNAFADHFLTDLFSAGHLRAPRKGLNDVPTRFGELGAAGGLLTRYMHDEDCYQGLKVRNRLGDHWVAYGDKRLLDSVSADNRHQVVAAVTASANDVWRAFNREDHHYSALDHVPDLDAVLSVTADDKAPDWNLSPLFRLDDGVVLRRTDTTDHKDFSWIKDWDPLDTVLKLNSTYRDDAKVKCYDLATGASLGWLAMGGNNYVQLTDIEKNAHLCSWYASDGLLYLHKQTDGGAQRYLGREYSNADWEFKGSALLYNEDRSISLRDDPARKLYLGDSGWLYWSDGTPNTHIIAFDLPLAPVISD